MSSELNSFELNTTELNEDASGSGSEFRNQDYWYQHLPARFRNADVTGLLYRFLQVPAGYLDGWDALYNGFYETINAATSEEPFITFWMWALFGWSWYPSWFTLSQKRALYAAFTQHLARRGTAIGIKNFLAAFSVRASAICRPQVWEEMVWGEPGWGAWAIDGPLGIVVQVRSIDDEVNFDTRGMAWGGVDGMVWGEGFFRNVAQTLTRTEIENLVRFEWPNSQRLMVEYVAYPDVTGETAWDEARPVLNESWVPDETGETVEGVQ
ncbi:MAG TPA: hypothetical protein VI756_08750 [Blastocatellia bacterium]